MGRKRRDQRDAIRKARAKRRKRTDESSDEGEFVASVAVTAATSESSPKTVKGINCSVEPTKKESEDQDIKPSADEQTDVDTANPLSNPDTSTSKVAAATKKPVDKIERMRLKKQHQKARRKEKKAARAAAASATKSNY